MATKTVLKLANDLTLPIEVAGQTIAIFGIRGSGKTNTAGALAEELLDHNHPIAIIDPTDAWWGLRAGRDGSAGYQVFIFGGPHADVPLQETDGKVIAEFLVREQVPAILSLRHLKKAAQRRFVKEFCEELYHLKGKPENRSPLTVFIDEAPLFIPQKVIGDVAFTVGAIEDLVARGRLSGFGVVLISQRPATLNADVRTQADTIICHRVTAFLDRKAIKEWFQENASVEGLQEILTSLATLKNGEGWVWSPPLNIMARVQMRMRRTFDSSATPKMGEKIRPPRHLAEIDIEKLKGQLSETIERSKADDPRELRKQIAELKKEIGAKLPKAADIDPEALKHAEKRGYDRAVSESRKAWGPLKTAVERAVESLQKNIPAELEWNETVIETPRLIGSRPAAPIAGKPLRPTVGHQFNVTTSGNGDLSGPEHRILDAIAWLESIGVERPEQVAVAFLAGYTFGGGAFNNPRGALRTKGFVDYAGDCICLTEEGRKHADFPDEVLTTAELQRRILERLPGPEQRILQVLIEAYPNAVDNDSCAKAAGYTPDGGAYNNPRGRLRTLGLIDYPQKGHVRARDILWI